MNIFVLKIWDDEGDKCTFYTVHKVDALQSETDKFFNRYEAETNEYHLYVNLLLRLVLNGIGDKYGAIDSFFDRHENYAQALPPRPKKWIPEIQELGSGFPLRLYCLRISETIVVLFDGGIKDSATAQASTDLSFAFHEAQTFALRIMKAFEDNTVKLAVNGRYLTDEDGHINNLMI